VDGVFSPLIPAPFASMSWSDSESIPCSEARVRERRNINGMFNLDA
jgi:hypothetical protein